MLRPKLYIKLHPQPTHSYLDSSSNCVLLPNSIEHDIDRADENLPHAINAEEVSEEIEVLSLKCLGPSLTLLHIFHVMKLEK